MPPHEQDSRELSNQLEMKYKFEAFQREIDLLKVSQAELKKEVDTYRKERDNLMVWGILALGGAVVAMGLWIFNSIPGIRK
jgi:hypothetical protein